MWLIWLCVRIKMHTNSMYTQKPSVSLTVLMFVTFENIASHCKNLRIWLVSFVFCFSYVFCLYIFRYYRGATKQAAGNVSCVIVSVLYSLSFFCPAPARTAKRVYFFIGVFVQYLKDAKLHIHMYICEFVTKNAQRWVKLCKVFFYLYIKTTIRRAEAKELRYICDCVSAHENQEHLVHKTDDNGYVCIRSNSCVLLLHYILQSLYVLKKMKSRRNSIGLF